ncbi:hypothetical protein NLU13_5085 [Sarocladium strictum]|uniref:Thioredoxin domain-containing protein n=1 Tax=Sarocladium strictum TaxID=5046 RepID=A0AA39GMS2_SARSR|nr:hypothetical protein NLU13_5085 [Sarocladium strictum]
MRAASVAGVACVLVSQALADRSPWNFITADDFKARLENKEQLLVAFVAPQDELSSALLPQWTELVENLDLTAAVNCTSVPAVCREAKVSTLPAIRLYQSDGSMVRYRGPKKALDIALFIERMNRPLITELTEENLSDFSTIDDFTAIGHFFENDDTLRADFTDMANKLRDRYTFGVHTLPAQDNNKVSTSQVVCRNNVDNLEYKLREFDRVGALEQLFEQCAAPLVIPLNRRTELGFNKIAKSAVYYFSDDEADREAYVDMARPVAKAFREYLVFATVDTNDYPQMPGMFGIQKRGLCLQVLQNGQVYHFTGEDMTAESLQNFIQAVSGGKAQAWDGKSGGTNNAHDEL